MRVTIGIPTRQPMRQNARPVRRLAIEVSRQRLDGVIQRDVAPEDIGVIAGPPQDLRELRDLAKGVNEPAAAGSHAQSRLQPLLAEEDLADQGLAARFGHLRLDPHPADNRQPPFGHHLLEESPILRAEALPVALHQHHLVLREPVFGITPQQRHRLIQNIRRPLARRGEGPIPFHVNMRVRYDKDARRSACALGVLRILARHPRGDGAERDAAVSQKRPACHRLGRRLGQSMELGIWHRNQWADMYAFQPPSAIVKRCCVRRRVQLDGHESPQTPPSP